MQNVILILGVQKSIIRTSLQKNTEIKKMVDDLQLTLQSLNYKNKEIKSILPIIIKETNLLNKTVENISFENLLKLAMNHLDMDSSNIVR